MKFAALEDRIAELQATLSQARYAVVNVNEEIRQRNRQLGERYERFVSQKRARDTSLAVDLAEINAARLTVEADIEERRQKVDAQIRSLEAHISAELREARNNLEALNTRLVDSFGRDHEGLDTAITRVLETNDDGLLYTATGTPRFDLSRPLTASVYTAVDRLESDRSEMDARIVLIEKSNGGANQRSTAKTATPGALEREQATLRNERQQLLEAYAASAREIQARSSMLEQRQRAIDARFADERAALGELYSARASLTRSEMQTVQRALVAAAKGVPGARSQRDSHSQLLNALHEKARGMGKSVDESLLAPHALMDWIASMGPDGAVSARPGAWVPFAARKTISSRELAGADKAALASAWLAQLRRQPRFASIRDELGASGAVKDAGQALSDLFMTGVVDYAMMTEQRLYDGGIGIQLSVLGRDYQLGADGSLEILPKR
jgi:Skp family chaperone for outer membrane proteins